MAHIRKLFQYLLYKDISNNTLSKLHKVSKKKIEEWKMSGFVTLR